MAKPSAISWNDIRTLALEAGVPLETFRSWKHRGDVPKAARWDLNVIARKRYRFSLTDADFAALSQPH